MDNSDVTVYNVKDVRNILRIGESKAYALMNSSSFPSIKLGNKFIVTKSEFEKWLDRSKGKTFYL